MPLTSNGLPYPQLGDTPDVVRDITALANAVNPHAAPRVKIAAGVASVTPATLIDGTYLGGDTALYRGSTAILFPSGLFTAVPFIVVTAETSVPGTLIEATFHTATTTGCTLSVGRTTQTATNVNWIAIQP